MRTPSDPVAELTAELLDLCRVPEAFHQKINRDYREAALLLASAGATAADLSGPGGWREWWKSSTPPTPKKVLAAWPVYHAEVVQPRKDRAAEDAYHVAACAETRQRVTDMRNRARYYAARQPDAGAARLAEQRSAIARYRVPEDELPAEPLPETQFFDALRAAARRFGASAYDPSFGCG